MISFLGLGQGIIGDYDLFCPGCIFPSYGTILFSVWFCPWKAGVFVFVFVLFAGTQSTKRSQFCECSTVDSLKTELCHIYDVFIDEISFRFR